ncbi:hypothetical protein [Bradyrhizobium japonicum]|uniref:hypothetical protein n=1 Tax=Bradyrhizobium japonicum TaxID=375 RepID=UPI0018AD382E|nr:hypothetical protein [Bradyrhizobium japonicum]
MVFKALKIGINRMADNSAWPDRAVKPRSGAPQELDGQGSDQAIIVGAVMSIVLISGRFLETERQSGWRTGPLRRSTRPAAANERRRS